MSSQNRLFLRLLGIALASVSIFGYSVIVYMETAFQDIQTQQEQEQINQFKRQFGWFGEAVVRRVEKIANIAIPRCDARTRALH